MRPAVPACLLALLALLAAPVSAGPGPEEPATDAVGGGFPIVEPQPARAPAPDAPGDAARADRPLSRSRGFVYRGLLDDGVRLQDSEHLHLLARHVENGRFWGTTEMADLLERSAARVAHAFPGARLTLGELSKEGGGAIVGHRSHESGRDADVGFYLRDEPLSFTAPPQFVRVRQSGLGNDGVGPVTFDDAANWALVEAWITDAEIPVQHIFVSLGVRRRLLRRAREEGVSEALIDRAARMMRQPGAGPRAHNEHFHLRIYCAARDREVCRDRGPWWHWTPRDHTPFWDSTDGPWR